MAEYGLTYAAEADLVDVWDYTLENHGTDQANAYIDILRDAFGMLAEFPHMAVDCSHLESGCRSFPVKRHVIYIELMERGVRILRILHQRAMPTGLSEFQ